MKIQNLVFLLFACYSPVLEAQAPSNADVKKAKTLAAEGKAAFEAETYEKALALFQEAYGLNPKPGYLANIGQSFSSLGRYQEALDAYQKFLEQSPADDPLRPAVEEEMTKTKQGLSSLKESAALSAKATAEKAFKESDYKKALDAYYEAYSLGPKPEYLIRIGQCHENLGQEPEAVSAYRSYLEKAPPTDTLRPAIEEAIAKLDKPEPTTENTIPQGPNPWISRLVIGGAASAGVGGVMGLIAISSAFKLNELGALEDDSELDPENIQKHHQRLKVFSAVSDVFLVAGAAAGGTVLYLKNKETKASVKVSVSPQAAVVTIKY